jgi:hypothetical protein
VNCKKQLSLQRIPSVQQAEALSTMFSSDNWVSFWKEYFLRKHSFQGGEMFV